MGDHTITTVPADGQAAVASPGGISEESCRERLEQLQDEYAKSLEQMLQIIEEKKSILLETRMLVLELGKARNEIALMTKKLDTNNARILAIKRSVPGRVASKAWRLYQKAINFILRKTRRIR